MLGIVCIEDIHNALLAAYENRDGQGKGYISALNVIALSFGLPRIETASPQIDIFDEYGTLLDGSAPTGLGKQIR